MEVPGAHAGAERTLMPRPTAAEKARLEHRDAIATVIYPEYQAVRQAQKLKGAARPRVTIGQEHFADEAERKADTILALPRPATLEA